MIARMMTQSGAGTVGSPQRRPAAGLTARPTADPQSAAAVCLSDGMQPCNYRRATDDDAGHPSSAVRHQSSLATGGGGGAVSRCALCAAPVAGSRGQLRAGGRTVTPRPTLAQSGAGRRAAEGDGPVNAARPACMGTARGVAAASRHQRPPKGCRWAVNGLVSAPSDRRRQRPAMAATGGRQRRCHGSLCHPWAADEASEPSADRRRDVSAVTPPRHR